MNLCLIGYKSFTVISSFLLHIGWDDHTSLFQCLYELVDLDFLGNGTLLFCLMGKHVMCDKEACLQIWIYACKIVEAKQTQSQSEQFSSPTSTAAHYPHNQYQEKWLCGLDIKFYCCEGALTVKLSLYAYLGICPAINSWSGLLSSSGEVL